MNINTGEIPMVTIADNLPLKFIKWCMSNKVDITMCRDYIDLNTDMKSHCHLFYEDGQYIAKMRYNESKVIEDFQDLEFAVRDCEQNRGFMSGTIEKIYSEGFGDISFDKFE